MECMLDGLPPPYDPTKPLPEGAVSSIFTERKKSTDVNESLATESETDESIARTDEDWIDNEYYLLDSFDDDLEWDSLEDEDDEEEEDEDEDEDAEKEFDYKKKEDGEEEEEEESEDDDDEDDPFKRMFVFHPSDEDFMESDLAERKKRRYMIGAHSFVDLADPHLEDALIPARVDEDDENLTEEEVELKGRKAEKDLYKKACEELGVKPDPTVLSSLRKRVMDLRGHGLNAKQIIAVCRVLEINTYVQYLILAENAAGNEGGLAIADLITKNTSIISYDLESTEILEAFPAICEAISTNPAILHLNFSKNDLEDIDMPHIRKILREIPLQTLSLHANYIEDDGLMYIGQGLAVNKTLEEINLAHNKIRGEKKAGVFFVSCGKLPLRILNLHRNFIRDEGGKRTAGVIANNPVLEEIDMGFNLMGNDAAAAFGRSLGRLKKKNLKILGVEFQKWRQPQGAIVLRPFGNNFLEMPIEVVDFGIMMDIHTEFIKAEEKALKVRPDLVIIHGQPFGLDHAKGPDHRQLVIRKADAVCKSFETPLVMLMEELAKERKDVLTPKEFRKFIKQCNLYKDKTLTEAFENVFEKKGEGKVDAIAILEAFDKEYPGLRVIPEPVEEEEEKPKKEKKKKKKKKGKKGKGKKGKGKKKAGGKGSKKKDKKK